MKEKEYEMKLFLNLKKLNKHSHSCCAPFSSISHCDVKRMPTGSTISTGSKIICERSKLIHGRNGLVPWPKAVLNECVAGARSLFFLLCPPSSVSFALPFCVIVLFSVFLAALTLRSSFGVGTACIRSSDQQLLDPISSSRRSEAALAIV